MSLPNINIPTRVPDLAQLGRKADLEKALAITVRPGDKVMVILPAGADIGEVQQVGAFLQRWAPEVSFTVLAGPTHVMRVRDDDEAPQGPASAVTEVKEL